MTEIKVLKRNGDKVEYDGNRIILAITKAMLEVKPMLSDEDKEVVENIENDIYDTISDSEDIEYSVESIQDLVENKLMEYNEFETAKKFILYRNERTTLREKGWEMTELQRDIFKNKYEYKNEGFNGFLDRVGGDNEKIKKYIRDKKFLPAGRILAGRGLYKDGIKTTYSNCYVLSTPEDNIESIFEASKKLARTFSYGGGVGLDISKLRPRGTKVNNSARYTTGAVSFMNLYSLVTELIGQNNRRGALMISIDCSHPDLEEFIDIKNDLNKVTKANISIKLTDEFMQAVKNNEEYMLTFTIEHTQEKIEKKVNAQELFRKLAKSNWNMAEPGTLFWDKINNWNLMSEDKDFSYASVNPCARW